MELFGPAYAAEIVRKPKESLIRVICSTGHVSFVARPPGTVNDACWFLPEFFAIVLHVTRSGLDHLRSAVRLHVEREGLRPLSVRTGVPVGQLRSLLQGRAALSTTLERVSSALGLEFYIGPPRKPGAARPRKGYEGSTVRERPPSGEESAPAWAMKLQRELRDGLREELAQVLREVTDSKPDSTPPKRPAADSPGRAE